MMGKAQFAIPVTLLAILVGITAFNTFKPAGAGAMTRPKWEYKIVGVPDPEFDTAMGTLGADGWELVFARRASGGREEKMLYECIFKRPQ
jgi:hypothetical protein